MSIVRVQLRRELAGHIAQGSWFTYYGAWFETPTAVPSATVVDHLIKLFGGTNQNNEYPSRWLGSDPFTSGPGNVQLKCYRFNGSNTEQTYNELHTMAIGAPLGGTTMRVLPSQSAICVGYRAPVGAVVQRGRSRLFYGPIQIPTSMILEDAPGGTRLTPAACATIAGSFNSCVSKLAQLGWTLVVRSGQGAGITAEAATEVYVDDVIDVMRSRRSWRLHQTRLNV